MNISNLEVTYLHSTPFLYETKESSTFAVEIIKTVTLSLIPQHYYKIFF